MLIATDPLSLVFIACFLFGLLFLLVTAFMGNLGHGHGLGHGQHIHIGTAHGHGVVHGHGTTHGTTHAGQQSQANGFSLLNIFNPLAIVLFLLWFGFFGYVLHNTVNLILPLSVVLSCVGGLVVAALLLTLINRIFGDGEGASIQDVSDRTGLVGKVNITIQEDSIGQISYTSPGGMRKSLAARSVDGRRIERDQEVVVLNYEHGVAEVDTWEHFINQENSETLNSPDDLTH